MHGYSDRINHALAFAAKHHDQQVRKGTRLPYLTHPANVGIILTRYGCADDIVVAGILHDVVEDCVREGWTRAMLESRIAEKFGESVLMAVLSVTKRKLDGDGNEMDRDERTADYIVRIGTATDAAKWVCAADKLHNANATLADLRRTMEPATVWSRFAGGRDGTVAFYRTVRERLHTSGFAAPIMDELGAAIEALAATP